MRHPRGALKLRVMFGPEIAMGPGKADLLDAIARDVGQSLGKK